MAKILVIGGLPSSLVYFRGPLLEAMVKKGHEVHACAAEGQDPQTKDQLANIGVTYHSYFLNSTCMNPLIDIKTVNSLSRLYDQIQPDIVFTYTIKPVIYGSFAAIIKQIPLRFSMIEGLGYTFMLYNWKDHIINRVVCWLYKTALKGNRKTFFLNKEDLSVFIDKGILNDDSQAVLLNGIGAELNHYTPAPSQTKSITFLLISRLMPDKGIDILINAARIIKQRHPSVRFQILGPLTDHPAGYKQTDLDHWQQEGVVEYLGVTDDVRPVIAQASVFVLPSYYREGLPRTIIEAMAMAKPIITSDAPGCRDTVVEGKNGFLLPLHDVDALVKAMQYFIDKPEQIEIMGIQSRAIAEDKFDVHKINSIIMQEMELSSTDGADFINVTL